MAYQTSATPALTIKRIERERIFKDKWTVIGVGSSVPNIGDAQPYNLTGHPSYHSKRQREKNKSIS